MRTTRSGPDVQRPADARQHRRTLRGIAAGLTAALATTGVLAVVLPLAEAPDPPPPASGSPPAAATDVGDFTDPARWTSLPELTRGALVTAEDLSTTFPADGAWEPSGNSDVGGQWVPSWCDTQTGAGELLDELVEPTSHEISTWIVSGGDHAVADLRLDTLRWAPGGGAEIAAAGAWLQEMTDGAAECDHGEPVETAGVPGQAPVMSVAPAGEGSWEVQAATVGGPTAMWVRATVPAPSADAAASAVAGLLTTAAQRLAVADDEASRLRDHPADRPVLGAGHLLTDADTGRRDRPADPAPVAAPVEGAALSTGWCPGASLEGAPLPAQAWATSWTEPGPFEPGFDVMEVQERVLRFSGLGDEGGVAAAQAYSAALRAGAQACAEAAAQGRQVHVSDYSIEGEDSLVVAVDQGDGTWRATATARDGVTVLVVSVRVQWSGEWYDDAVIGVTSAAWRRVDEADGTVR